MRPAANIWVVILFLPAGIITLFKTGPFAWDGLIAFWIPALVFFICAFAMCALLLKAIRWQEAGCGGLKIPVQAHAISRERRNDVVGAEVIDEARQVVLLVQQVAAECA